ncbi:MAG: CHASE2 domain-containing protein, partial [Cyanobacteria bacterium P01_C01_bin.38]
QVCQQLQASLNAWLRFEPFQNIERQLRTLLSRDDEVRIIVETDIALLHSLPWHLWDFFDDYPKAELALSNNEYASPQVLRKFPTGKVNILAVLGNRVGIDIDKDSDLLKNLTDAQTTFLIEPTRTELDEQLWNYDWDILFFAGHSASFADGEIGEIYINDTESLTISQLKNALKKAISRGLNIAIFNSCDGIGLARNLAELNIPQMIVMRTKVPDFVAQEFLKNFLITFANAKNLYLSVREARERLQGLETKFPCASWLPVIYQNPTTDSTTWEELKGNVSQTLSEDKLVRNQTSFSKYKLLAFILSSFIGLLSSISLRYLGVFETIELQTFDQILRLKPQEPQDRRVVIVEVTEEDIQYLQEYPLTDGTVAKLLSKLQKYKPRVIGLDIYRDFAITSEKSNQIQLPTQLSEENIVVVCKGKDREKDSEGVKPPPSVAVERQGFTDAIKDPDGIVRRQILMMQQEPNSPCETPYSLSFQLASRYLSDEFIELEVDDDANGIKFGSKELKRLKPTLSGPYQSNVDLGGMQLLVNYRNTDFLTVSLRDVFNDRVSAEQLQDKVLLVGVTANTISDHWSTPYSTIKKNFQEIPGVIIQAQKASQIISAFIDNRPVIWFLNSWGDIIWIYASSVLGTTIIWFVRSPSHKAFAIATTIICLYGAYAIALLNQGLWIPFIPSAFALVVSAGVVLIVPMSTSKRLKSGNGEQGMGNGEWGVGSRE